MEQLAIGWSQSNAPSSLSEPSNYRKKFIISWIIEDKIDFRGITRDVSEEI